MGAWSDLELSSDTLKGVAEIDFVDPDTGDYDADRVTAQYITAAKRYVETRLIRTMPELMARAGGPEAFMDVVSARTTIASIVQEILAWSFLLHYYRQESMGNSDVFSANETNAKMRFEDAYTSMTAYLKNDTTFIAALETASSKGMGRFDDPIFIG